MSFLSQLFMPPAIPPGDQRMITGTSDLLNPASWLFYAGPQSSAGVIVTPDTALRATACFKAVRLYAKTIAMYPLNIYKFMPNGGKQVDKDHPLYDILHNQPNPEQTSFEFREMMQGHNCLRGNSYAQKIRNGKKQIVALIPLHPDRVQVKRAADSSLIYEYMQPGGVMVPLKRDQVLHIRAFSTDGIMGLSPISMGMDAIALARATELYGGRFFSQNSMTNGYFKHPGVMGTEAQKNFKESMREQYSGLDNAHATAVLEEGMDFVSVGMKHEEMQYLETRRFQVEDLARLWELPTHKLNNNENSTFSNNEQAQIEFFDESISPVAIRWEQALTRDLLSPEDRKTHCIKFQFANMLRGDTAARTAYFSAARQWGWMNIDDVREAEDMNLLPGGAGQDYLQPMNMQIAGKEPPAPVVMAPKPANGEDPAVDDPANPPLKPIKNPPTTLGNAPKKRSIERELRAATTIFADVLGRIMRKESAELTKNTRNLAQNGDLSAFHSEMEAFFVKHEAFVADAVLPAVKATFELEERSDSAEAWATVYAHDLVYSSRESLRGIVLDKEPIAKLEALIEKLKSQLRTTSWAREAVETILTGEDDEQA